MPQPTRSDVHVNRPLTNISIAFMQDLKNFVAGRVFPSVSVSKQSDVYFKYTQADWFRSDAQKRAPGTESAGSGFGISTDSYSCDVFALHKDIDDQVRDNQDDPIALDRDAAQWLAQQLLLKLEKEWVAEFFTTSVWTGSTTAGDITPSTLWSASGSDPVADVDAQKDSMLRKTGYMPNKLVVGPKIHTALRSNAAILDRIKYTQKGVPTEDILASLFGVDEYMVARATENTAKEGATASYSLLYDNDALLCYSAPSPGILKPSAGYTFNWSGFMGSQNSGMRMKSFRMEQLGSDRVEGEMAFDQKLVAADLGVFFLNAVT